MCVGLHPHSFSEMPVGLVGALAKILDLIIESLTKKLHFCRNFGRIQTYCISQKLGISSDESY